MRPRDRLSGGRLLVRDRERAKPEALRDVRVDCAFQKFCFVSSHKPIKMRSMNDEKISVRVTETGQSMDVVVLSKRADRIQVVLGEGVHSVRCELTPTRTALAYVGSVMGREIVYERSRALVQADIDRLNPVVGKPRRR
jgi:hypothetical protein